MYVPNSNLTSWLVALDVGDQVAVEPPITSPPLVDRSSHACLGKLIRLESCNALRFGSVCLECRRLMGLFQIMLCVSIQKFQKLSCVAKQEPWWALSRTTHVARHGTVLGFTQLVETLIA